MQPEKMHDTINEKKTKNGGTSLDTFIEQMIKRKLGAKDYLIMTGVCLLGIILVFACIFDFLFTHYTGMLFVLLIGGVVFGAYKLIRFRSLEFEYNFTNGDLTVDKIIDRSRRKRVVSFDVKNTFEMGRLTDSNYPALSQRSVGEKYYAGVSADGVSEDSWYMLGEKKGGGTFLLFFDPNERVLDSIREFLPRQVRVETFGR